MKYEDLPKEMQKAYDGLKHSFLSIQCEVEDALDEAKNLEEFKELVSTKMREIRDASSSVSNQFALIQSQAAIQERDRIIFGEEINWPEEKYKTFEDLDTEKFNHLKELDIDIWAPEMCDIEVFEEVIRIDPKNLKVGGDVHSDHITLTTISGKGLSQKDVETFIRMCRHGDELDFDFKKGEVYTYWS